MNRIHEYINNLDYAVVIAYLVVLIGIGFWVSFVKKKKEGEKKCDKSRRSESVAKMKKT